MREKGLLGKAGRYLWRLKNKAAPQWMWFVLGIEPGRVGYGKGPLTWAREARHGRSKRRVHLCLLEYSTNGEGFGRFMTYWINERSKACTASLNKWVESADVVWVYSQDPLSPDVRDRLLRTLEKSPPGARAVNHPDAYASVNGEGVFERLAEAGVSVPRSRFGREDEGETWVVYKAEGQHAAPKSLVRYSGSRDGYKAFEFVDSRGPDGLYRRYRAIHLLGTIRKGVLMLGRDWNMYSGNMERKEHAFEITPFEAEQVRLIAETLGLQYFSVDYLRRGSDDSPVFVDVNLYPSPVLLETGEASGFYGRWHNFDAYERLENGGPPGGPYWNVFDETMLRLTGADPEGPPVPSLADVV